MEDGERLRGVVGESKSCSDALVGDEANKKASIIFNYKSSQEIET